jgi:hypothetical protein
MKDTIRGHQRHFEACSPLQSPTQAHSKSHQRELDVRSRPRDERLRNAPRHRPSIDPRARAEAPVLNGNQAHQKHLGSMAIRLIRSTWAHQWQSGSSVAIRLISGNQAHQWQSSVALIRGTERHSIALSGTQVHSIELTSPPRFVIAVASEFATACANKREGHKSVVASGSLH